MPQTIPTFSLLYVGMLHDYWMYRPDAAFVKSLVPGTRTVLEWYAQYEQPDGLLRRLPWWSFIDWLSQVKFQPTMRRMRSCMTTLEYLGALNDAADLNRRWRCGACRSLPGAGGACARGDLCQVLDRRSADWWRTIPT